jgi:hypothetical protein
MRRRWSARRGDPPRERDGAIAWSALGGRGAVRIAAAAPAIRTRLWDGEGAGASDGGTVEWCCAAPVGAVTATVRGLPDFSGVGYAEHLAMSVPPWRLPIGRLRWGRWCDDAGGRSLVWIDWAGPPARRWAYLDGRPVEAHVGEAEVSGDGFSLALADRAVLEDRRFVDVARHVPGLTQVLPPSMRGMRETKWLSHGSLRLHRDRAIPGTVIHELVVMP